jgi:hypothetical protein
MKIKALTGIEASHPSIDEDENGNIIVKYTPILLKEGEVVDIDDKLAGRLIKNGHASEDLEAETNLDRVRREAAQQQD